MYLSKVHACCNTISGHCFLHDSSISVKMHIYIYTGLGPHCPKAQAESSHSKFNSLQKTLACTTRYHNFSLQYSVSFARQLFLGKPKSIPIWPSEQKMSLYLGNSNTFAHYFMHQYG